jgi:phage-related protein
MPTISTLTVDVQSRTSSFSKGLKVAIGGLAALAAGAAYAFSKFEESENVLQQTEAVLKSTGGAAKVTAEEVQGLADALSRKSAIDDEVIQSGLNMLLTFKNIRNEVGANNDIFNQASVAVTDLAAGMAAASGGEVDLKAASIQLGKALNDPVLGMTALTRVGVQFSAEQQKSIAGFVKHNNIIGAQKIILAELTSQFAGSAKAQATSSAAMGVAFENLAEIVGQALAPAITALLNALTVTAEFLQANVGPALQKTAEWFQKVWVVIGPLVTRVGSELFEALQQVWSALQQRVFPALQKVWQAVQTLWEAVGPLIKIWLVIQAVWIKIALEVLPVVVAAIGFVIDVIAALIDWIGKAVIWIKDRFIGAWNAVKGPVLGVINSIISAIETLIGWIQSAINWLKQLGQGVGGALGGKVGDVLPPGFNPNAMPNVAGASGMPIELHLHGDLAALVDHVDQGLAGKAKRNVRLAHHGR